MRVSQTIDRIDTTFDDPNLVANAGLVLVATLRNQHRPSTTYLTQPDRWIEV